MKNSSSLSSGNVLGKLHIHKKITPLIRIFKFICVELSKIDYYDSFNFSLCVVVSRLLIFMYISALPFA